jgi:hypothetical protein
LAGLVIIIGASSLICVLFSFIFFKGFNKIFSTDSFVLDCNHDLWWYGLVCFPKVDEVFLGRASRRIVAGCLLALIYKTERSIKKVF